MYTEIAEEMKQKTFKTKPKDLEQKRNGKVYKLKGNISSGQKVKGGDSPCLLSWEPTQSTKDSGVPNSRTSKSR